DEGQRAIGGEGDIEAVRGEGQLAGIGEQERRGSGLGAQRVLSLQARGLLEHSGRDIDTGGDGALLGQPPRALAGTAPYLVGLLAFDVADDVSVRFDNLLRSPDYMLCVEESAMHAENALGVIVTSATIAPNRCLRAGLQISAPVYRCPVSSLPARSSVAT